MTAWMAYPPNRGGLVLVALVAIVGTVCAQVRVIRALRRAGTEVTR